VAVAYLGRAVVDAVYGYIDGLLTMPISKFWAKMAGFSYEGQTEFLARAFRVRDYAMLMYSETIKVALLSTHISLKEAIERVKRENIVKKVKLLAEEFKRWFKKSPQIGVLGLNPHAGEGGTIGEEDIKEIVPAVEELKSMGYMVDGPLSPDTAFLNRDYDLFLCMYHDQGLIPFKLLAFREGVNMTLGIPFPRTSPDHGTAYDIAWKGVADVSPSLHALRLCERLAKNNK
jgi:4-hydroxythreonine-4-phosphate dehydrogenase (EC 1.1.1.262)